MKQRIAFLYLNTGGGHIGPAKALSRELETAFHDTAEPVLCNGFSDTMHISRFFFEDGYSITSNYFESGYVLFYRCTELPACMEFGNYFVSLRGERYLADFFREQKITKVVCLHEVLLIMARRALNRVNPSIPLLTFVTDPFSAHALWFYEKNTELIVFSEKLRKEAISNDMDARVNECICFRLFSRNNMIVHTRNRRFATPARVSVYPKAKRYC